MGKTIRGIIIQLGGDTGPLQKALEGAEKSSRSLQTELKEVNRQLKFDPTNTELLRQKQDLLSKSIATTKEKLDALREAQEKVNKAHAANAEWEKEYAPLKKQIDDTKSKLKDLTSQQETFEKNLASGKISTAQYEKFQKEIQETTQKSKDLAKQQQDLEKQFADGHISDEQYRSFQRTVTETEGKLKSLEKQAAETGSTLGVKMESAGSKISDAGNKISGVGEKLLPATGAVVAIGAAAVKTGDDFEAQMSRVSAISGATGDDLKALNNQALQLGQDTAFSASEAAEGMENLASAGFSTKEIMAAMPGMLDLAASSGEDLATSSDIAASTLRGFNLAAGDAGHVADVLAKNAADTNAAVADTGAAMKYIAPVAQNVGWSLESVTAAIGDMANAGIKGEQAGTTLRGALTNLMNPSKEQAAAMKEIGFNAYDAQGKMKPLSQIIGDLGQKTKGMTNQQRDQIVATIMGTDALSGMQVLLKDGKGNLDKLTTSLQNSDGAAKKMANTMQGNTKGSIEQMKGSIETAAIKIQQMLAPTITKIAQEISNLVNKFSALSPVQQQMILKIAAVVAAVAPALIIIGKMSTGVGAITKGLGKAITAIKNFHTALSGGATLAKALSAALTPAGAVIAAVVAIAAVIALLVIGIKHLWDTNEGFRNAVTKIWNGLQSVVTTVVNAVIGAWNGLVAFFTGIPAWWNNLWQQVGQLFTNVWNNIINFITQKIPQIIQNIIQWFQQLPYNIGYALGAALAAVVSWCVNMFNTVKTQIPIIINNVIQWFQQLPGRIWTFLLQAIANIGKWCANMLSTVRAQIPILINNVGTFFSQLPGRIWTFLVDTVNKVKQWCGNLITTAQTEIPKFVQSVVNFIGELPGKMLKIGENIVHGIWDGINGAISWLHDRISDFCSGIVDGFKKNLKIHSPSRLFADVIGKNIALGIGQGFTDNIAAVAQAMTAAIPIPDSGPQVRTAFAAAYGGYQSPTPSKPSGSAGENSGGADSKGGVTVNQYFEGKVPSAAEHARKTRNELQQVVLKLKKG